MELERIYQELCAGSYSSLESYIQAHAKSSKHLSSAKQNGSTSASKSNSKHNKHAAGASAGQSASTGSSVPVEVDARGLSLAHYAVRARSLRALDLLVRSGVLQVRSYLICL